MDLRLNVLTEEHPKAACKIIKLSRGKKTSYNGNSNGENILLMSVDCLY